MSNGAAAVLILWTILGTFCTCMWLFPAQTMLAVAGIIWIAGSVVVYKAANRR